MGQRIAFLDGLRGIAILAVMFHHVYINYQGPFPFASRWAALPLRLGWEGVELFFLISGFVILMTLENSASFTQFMIKRWRRLFPAMLLVSIGLFALFASLGAQRPFIDLVPGLTFINPSLIHAVTRLSPRSLDPVFWTLYIEAVFYVVFGICYFVAGAGYSIFAIFFLFVLAVISRLIFGLSLENIASRLAGAMSWIGFVYFGWFASGSAFYVFFSKRKRLWLWLGILGATISASISYPISGSPSGFINNVGFLCVTALFVASIASKRLQNILSCRSLLFVGFISYPLYLVHDALVVTFMTEIARSAPHLAPLLWPIPLLVAVATGWVLARYGEPSVLSVMPPSPAKLGRFNSY